MYLFNPENDLALANFSANYTPPASAVKIAADLALLPVWYAPAGAKVIASTVQDGPYLSWLQEKFILRNRLVSLFDIPLFPEEEIIPWGWNPALRKKLLDAGVSKEKLPTMEALAQLRSDSGRQNAVAVLNELRSESRVFCGEAHFFNKIDDLLLFLHSHPGDHVMKMPNSGSGKGLSWVKGKITDKQTDWCRRVIHEQGGLVAEPVLIKIEDFAMEFNLADNTATFIGYSLFESTPSGAYSGNLLLDEAEVEARLSQYTGREMLLQLRNSLSGKLSHRFPGYSGYLGVDMMVCRTESGYRIHPCVEINLRMNMGVVAHLFYNRFVKSGSTGKFMIDFFKREGDAAAFMRKMSSDYPLVVEYGKIVAGFLPLTPVTEQTCYMAWVLIAPSSPLQQNIYKRAE